ncbi:MAG: hypothetical protein ABW321_02075 [Polyangiales bacterium]
MVKRGLRKFNGRRGLRTFGHPSGSMSHPGAAHLMRPAHAAESSDATTAVGPIARLSFVSQLPAPLPVPPSAAGAAALDFMRAEPRAAAHEPEIVVEVDIEGAHDAHDAHDALVAHDAHDPTAYDHPTAASFFAADPDDDDDQRSAGLRPVQRRAMLATFGMLAVFLLWLGGFLLYERVLMPAPVELNSAADSLYDDSAALAEQAALVPVNPEQLDKTGFEGAMQTADRLASHGQSGPALALYERALQLKPNAPTALAGKAYAYLNLNDRKAAKQYATQAVAVDATNAQAWVVLGIAEDLLGRRRAAQDAFRHCTTQGVGDYVADCRQLAR